MSRNREVGYGVRPSGSGNSERYCSGLGCGVFPSDEGPTANGDVEISHAHSVGLPSPRDVKKELLDGGGQPPLDQAEQLYTARLAKIRGKKC